MKRLAQVNDMTLERFVETFGDVAEHSAWVAEAAARKRPFASRQAMIEAFTDALLGATPEAQLAVLKAHPDLAGKAKLTPDSSSEQKGAGLDTLSPLEFGRFTGLNSRYKMRFGFPFIFAVRGATKHQIIDSFERRINGGADAEFAMALDQVCRIISFRIEDRVAP